MNISLDSISKAEALRYMGQRGEYSEGLEKLLCECEKKLLCHINPRFMFRVFDIQKNNDELFLSGTKLSLSGRDIAVHLENCERAVLMCATLGEGADRLIREAEVSDISSAFALDALASAAIEEVCNKAEEEIEKRLGGFYLTWRFSPGYGDFPLSIQREFLETLGAQKQIGLCTEINNILVPRKSVTAVLGVSQIPLPKKQRGCAVCNMKEQCAYRKRGDHCGF